MGPLDGATQAAEARQVAPRPHTGRVLNQAHEPLSGATVLVQVPLIGVSTNADGTFLLPLAPGPHTLMVNYLNCRSVVLSVARPDSALLVVLATTLAPRRYR